MIDFLITFHKYLMETYRQLMKRLKDEQTRELVRQHNKRDKEIMDGCDRHSNYLRTLHQKIRPDVLDRNPNSGDADT